VSNGPIPEKLGAIPLSILRRLQRPEDFTRGPITREEWEWLVAGDWHCDGSSNSLDDIEGVRIGRSGVDYADANLPANRHDFWYALGRVFKLGAAFRAAADADYRDQCKQRVGAALIGVNAWKGRRRAEARWLVLRVAGRRAFRS
jgi:hypothetical protein